MSQTIIDRLGVVTVVIAPGLEGTRNTLTRGLKRIICSAFQDDGLKRHILLVGGLFDVLGYIEDEKGFLSAIKGLLVTNGRFYMTVPAHNFF